MLRFFRSLRQGLMAENPPEQAGRAGRFRKYFPYALGEIVLVVIGILIALQIDTWNEGRKTDIEIRGRLRALQEDLVKDTLLIVAYLPEVAHQYQLNELLRSRVAHPAASLDTLLKVVRFEFNPNWTEPLFYNTNAYFGLNQTGLIENLPDPVKSQIKDYYNGKFYRTGKVTRITADYRNKVSGFVETYTFGSTGIHDQGPLIDSLVWMKIDPAHLAASFQGISNFKRLLFQATREEMKYSLEHSRLLIGELENYLETHD